MGTSLLQWARSPRRPTIVLLAAVLLAALAAVAPACSDEESSALGPVGGGTGLEGLVSLAISPPSAVLQLTYGSNVTQQFTVTGTFADGSARDVTTEVQWSTDAPSGAVTEGLFATDMPGLGVVMAAVVGMETTATVAVVLQGEVDLPGTPAGAGPKLEGTPDGAAKPVIAYPLDGALFPYNLGNTEFHLSKGDSSQSLARVHLTGDLIDLKILGPCEAIAGVNGCAVTLTDALVPALAGASEGPNMEVRVRLAAADGSALGESDAIDVRWTFTKVGGGLYYWSARDNADTHIYRYDLDQKGTPPADFFSDQDSPPLHDGTQQPCVGCHAISLDGEKIALTFGGSNASDFTLLEVATKQAIAVKNTDADGYATFSALSPDGVYIVNSFRGGLMLRQADSTLADLAEITSAETAAEALAQPFWAADGLALAYVGWQPGQHGANDSSNGDVVRGAQIFITDIDAATVGQTRLLVPRESGHSAYYPAISDDGEWVVYNRSRCDGPPGLKGYGEDPCDGYDDASAEVYVVPFEGGERVLLSRASGDETWTNSWPRWSPSHGSFQGKNIHFIAFSTKRPYGLRLAGSTDGSTVPQLWLAAVALDPDAPPSSDPSFAPVWMPLQNEDMSDPTGNHVPQWAAKAYPVPN